MSQAIAKDEPLKPATDTASRKPKIWRQTCRCSRSSHGGIDTGAIGRNGSKEKHVVLAIAKNVRSILRNHGIDARLTRSGDTFIPLYDRVEIAHKHGADLFMSIHADGFTNPKAAGASVLPSLTVGQVAQWRNTCLNAKTAPMKLPVKGD